MKEIHYETLRGAQSKATLEQLKQNGKYIIGLEVIEPLLQPLVDENIDPQHTDKRSDTSAIDYALKNSKSIIEKAGDKPVAFVTSRADLDSLGAMVVLKMALEGRIEELAMPDFADRVKKINKYDNYTLVEKWSPKPIEEAIREGGGDFGAINAAVADFKVQVAERVKIMENYLIAGVQPQKYIDQYEQELIDISKSIENQTTIIDVKTCPGIAIVKSPHSKGPQIGYANAPGGIIYNEKFRREGSNEDQVKFSICQIPRVKVFDFEKLKEDLNNLEKDYAQGSQERWGGNPNFLGSPMMNNGTKIPVDLVKKTVISDILPEYQSLFSEVSSDFTNDQIIEQVGKVMASYDYH